MAPNVPFSTPEERLLDRYRTAAIPLTGLKTAPPRAFGRPEL